MKEMRVYEKEIVSANILRVAAGTTGLCGGDSGHGGRTRVEIEDLANTDVTFIVEKDGRQLRIELGGDTELQTFIEALKFASKILERETYTEVFEAWGRKPYRQTDNLAVELYDAGAGGRAMVMIKNFKAKLLAVCKQYNIAMGEGEINHASSFAPSFEDLHAIIQGIVACEQEKYRFSNDPTKLLREFLYDAVNEPDFSMLAQKYKIKTE